MGRAWHTKGHALPQVAEAAAASVVSKVCAVRELRMRFRCYAASYFIHGTPITCRRHRYRCTAVVGSP